MPVVPLPQFRDALPKGKRVLGIDQGSKTWGLAIANFDLTMATPLKTIQRSKFTQDVQTLAKLCAEYSIAGLIIGLPLSMDGMEGPRVDSVRHFADNLIKARDALGFEPVISFFDERLSTYAVEDLLNEQGNISREKRDKIIDMLAAQVILQGALDQMARHKV